MLAIDGQQDQIVKCLASSKNTKSIGNYKELKEYDIDIPVIFRSMAHGLKIIEIASFTNCGNKNYRI